MLRYEENKRKVESYLETIVQPIQIEDIETDDSDDRLIVTLKNKTGNKYLQGNRK